MNKKHHESQLQASCIRWFDFQYARFSQLLFAIPNGGQRSKVEAKIMQGEGVRPGVADLFLSIPKRSTKTGDVLYHGLYIEMKYGKNKQSDKQKLFESLVKGQGYQYETIYDFDRFQKVVVEYLR